MAASVAAVASLPGLTPLSAAAATSSDRDNPKIVGHFTQIVVIYEENHSFDNLYGTWGTVGGDHVDGVAQAKAAHFRQVAQDGSTYSCLLQKDVNLTVPPLRSSCADSAHGISASAFRNAPFALDPLVGPEDTTCPEPGSPAPEGVLKGSGQPGGCTRDLVHRFYHTSTRSTGVGRTATRPAAMRPD